MGHHRRAASWAAIPTGPIASPASSTSNLSSKTTIGPSPRPSLSTDTRDSTFTQQLLEPRSDSSLLTKSMFSLPSVCLFSLQALSNEYSEEKDIVPFISPVAALDRVTVLIGVLESMMDIVNEITTIENEDEDIMNDIEEEEKDEDADDENPFVILGLSTCKVCIWKAMGDYVIDEVRHKDDLCLVVMVASHFSDILIQKRMQLLRESLNASHISTSDATTEQIGEHLVLLVQYWFNRAEDQEDI